MPAKRQKRASLTLIAVATSLIGSSAEGVNAQTRSDRVIVVTLDGMRWQEIFDGANRALITSLDGGVADTTSTLRRFWRDDRAARRKALMPFLWGTMVEQGTLIGDSTEGSIARVTNGMRFSYPGYNELFSGAADDRIDSNDKIPNPNVTVLEWLASRPPFRGSVAVFGSWDVFPSIFNVERSKLPVNGDGPPFPDARTEAERTANRMSEWLPAHWAGARLDAPTMAGALLTLEAKQPRVSVALLGETDEWAHARRYDLYLDAAYRADRYLEQLWRAAESLPDARGRTSLIVSTDHGRGSTGRDWTDHGRDVLAAERIWIAVMGPRTTRLGVAKGVNATQSQVAATIAALVGEDWQSARPAAARAIGAVVR